MAKKHLGIEVEVKDSDVIFHLKDTREAETFMQKWYIKDRYKCEECNQWFFGTQHPQYDRNIGYNEYYMLCPFCNHKQYVECYWR